MKQISAEDRTEIHFAPQDAADDEMSQWLGPATDGGYYLIGLHQPAPRLFEDVEWSTARVLSTTLARIRERQFSHALLEEKEDIDDLAPLTRHGGGG